MAYSDKDLRTFTQIAYTNFSDAAEILVKDSDNGNVDCTIANLESKTNPPKDGYPYNTTITDDQKQNWKIVSIHDTNAQNGFYACIVETSPGNAVVCFRGTEDLIDLHREASFQHEFDGINADLGTLNSVCTNQQAEAEKFLAANKELLSKYDNITMTGHSLGGNLAEYATIMSYKYGLDKKIKQCVSLDGNGFSDEFINANKDHIIAMSGVMKHYRWSFVSGMLLELPGVEYKDVAINDLATRLEHPILFAGWKHDTKYLKYDENGNFVFGKRDSIQIVLSKITGMIEKGEWSFGTNIVNFYKIFRGVFPSMYLKVDITQLLSDADDMSFEIEEILKEVRSVYDDVQALGAMWQGTASDKFATSFGEEYTKINEYLTELKKCVDHVKISAEDYNSCEQQIYSMVESISV